LASCARTCPQRWADLRSLYIDLFEAGLPQPRCPLLESAWLLNRPAGDVVLENKLFYQNFGLEIDGRAAPDHLLSVGCWFLFGQVLLMALLGTACMGQLTGWQTAAAFIPVLFRGFAWFASAPQPLAAQELGKCELMHAAVFCALLVAARSSVIGLGLH
jgi:hypothetical protein